MPLAINSLGRVHTHARIHIRIKVTSRSQAHAWFRNLKCVSKERSFLNKCNIVLVQHHDNQLDDIIIINLLFIQLTVNNLLTLTMEILHALWEMMEFILIKTHVLSRAIQDTH